MNRPIWRIKLIVMLFLLLLFPLIVLSETQETIYIDDMETIENWFIGGEGGTNSYIRNVPGKSGKAIEINYEFIFGNWVQMQKGDTLNIEDAEQLEFYYKGSGNANALEVKLMDSDGTTFGKDFSGITDTQDEWKSLTLPISQMRYLWGDTDKELNKAEIEEIFFAIISEEGGKGTIVIDEVKFIK